MNKDLLKKRYKKEKRFILIGRIAVSLTIIFLVILLGSILLRGISGFYTTNISLKTNLLEEIIDPAQNKNADEIFKASWRKVSRTAIYNILDDYNDSKNIEKSTRKEKRDFIRLFSRSSEFYVRDYTLKNINNIGEVVTINVPASSLVDQYLKGKIDINLDESNRPISDAQISWINFMVEKNDRKKFNVSFFQMVIVGILKRLEFLEQWWDPF